MAFDPDAYLAQKEKPASKTRFKSPDVQAGFAKVDPALRAIAETIPATVTSTYRTPEENAAVGGVSNSWHTRGGAIDYRKGELTPDARKRLQDAGYEIITESDHDHVEPSGRPPKAQKSSFDPDAYLASKETPQEDQNRALLKNESGSLSGLIQNAVQNKIKEVEQNPEETPKSLKAGLVGMARTFPGSDISQAGMDYLSGLISGDPKKFGEYYEDAQNRGKSFEEADPTAALVGKTAASIPLYAMGMQGLGVTQATPLLGKVGAGALTSATMGQSARGLEGDPKSIAIDAALGLAGEGLPYAPYAVSKAGNKLRGFLKTSKIPERLYGQATGLSDTILESPEIIESLLKENIVPKFGKGIQSLQGVAEASKKSIGGKMNEALAGKAIMPDEVINRLPNAGRFSDDFAAGSGEAAEDAANKVLEELKGRIVKTQVEEIPGGVMRRPSLERFSEDLISKYRPRVDPEIKTTSIYGESVPEPPPRIFNPEPTGEDIARLYQQQFPEESISLPSRKVEKTAPVELSKLNREKQLLAKESGRVYESEGLKGTARQKAQKESADVLRRIVEEQAPEMGALNKNYHIYDELGEGIQKILAKDYRRIPLIEESPFKSRITELALGATRGGKARNAARLFRFANRQVPEASLKPSLFSYPAMNRLVEVLREQ